MLIAGRGTAQGTAQGTAGRSGPATASFWRDRGVLVTGGALLLLAAAAWVGVVLQASGMDMAATGGSAGVLSPAAAGVFVAGWGVMMAAMMLPSAMPMIALYALVSREPNGPPAAARSRRRAVPTAAFAAVYLLVWLLTGVPVYLGGEAVAAYAGADPGGARWLPYALAAVLAAAGIYQFSAIKRVCLKRCQSPLAYLMERWRPGYAAALRLGLGHAAYCVGCCWGLMVVLVVAGAMSLPWVLLIAALVFAEKVLPHGQWTARLLGGALVLLGLAVAVYPDLAVALRGQSMAPMAPMPPMGM